MTARGLREAFVFVIEFLLMAALIFTVIELLAACHAVPDNGTLPGSPSKLPRIQTVALAPGLDAYAESLDSAVELWNEAIGATALRVIDDYGQADIGIAALLSPMASRQNWLACSDPSEGLIAYMRPGDVYQAYLVFAHELGHAAFWLADDTDHGYSIMAGVGGASDPRNGELWPRMRHVAVTQSDIESIRRRIH